MAQKKDKADDSDGDKPAKREQAGGGKKNNAGGGGGQRPNQGGGGQRPNQGGGGGGGGGQRQNQGGGGGGQNKKAADPTPAKKKPAPQTAERPAKPKAAPTPAPAKKKDSTPAPSRPKPDNGQANKGKDSGPGNNQANKDRDSRPDNNPGNKARDNDQANKGKDSRPDAGGKKEPMPLPGKRPEMADRDGKGNKGGNNDNKGDNKANRPDNNNEAKAARSEDRARNNKPLDLPGKRPAVQRVNRDERPDGKVSGRARSERDPGAKQAAKGVRPTPVVRPGQNTRQVRRVNVDNSNTSKAWYNNRRAGDGRDVRIVNNTYINNNFRRNVNWSTRRHDWGYNPWWNRPQVRPWYGSTWNFGWNRDYYHRHYYYGHSYGYRPPGYSVGVAIGWGLVGWSLGTLAYDTGYYSYYNPYPVRTQVVYRGGENFSYDQPIARVAVDTAPADDEQVATLTEKSESIIAQSQTAFKEQNYLVALELADKAIAETPGDGALHEYRALVLFALGKYGDAAGVLNPVLASGPGWDWSTMVALYPSQQVYTDQLQRLEDYTEKTPDAADTHFLLGYHYMVCGHLDLATPQFDLAAKLMPKDSVSRQLADLTRSSTTAEESESAAESTDDADDAPAPEVVPVEKLEGTWTSTRDDGGTVKLTFKKDGKFTWSYQKDGKDKEFSGDYSMNDNGQLVLDSEETQMVATVDLPQESEMKFVLAGGPPEDPGLAFKKG